MPTFTQRTAIIAGGAGRIGFEVLRRFCEQGMNVAVFGSSTEKAHHTVEQLDEHSRNCLPIGCDVADTNAVRSALAKTNDTFGGIDVIVAMQGWPPQKQEIADITDECWNGMLGSHLVGSFHLLQQAIPYLEKSAAPRVIFFASDGTNKDDIEPGLAYLAAKSGIVAMTRCTAKMLAPKGITVNCIAAHGFHNGPRSENTPERIPSGKHLSPEALFASMCCYLANENAGVISGEVLSVNNELTIKQVSSE